MQIKPPPLPRHRGLPVYTDDDLRQAFPHLLDDPTMYIAIKPDGLAPDGATGGLLNHKIIGLRALAAKTQINDSIKKIEDHLRLNNLAEEDAKVLNFVADAVTHADEREAVTAFLPSRKPHRQPRAMTLRNVAKAHRHLAMEYPSLFAETAENGSVKLRQGKPVPDRLAIDAFMGFLSDVKTKCPTPEERAAEAKKYADAANTISDQHYLQTQLAQYQPALPVTSAGLFGKAKAFVHRQRHRAKQRRELWTVIKDEKGTPILNERHEVILRKVDPYGEEFFGSVKRFGSELTGFFAHKEITDPCARSLLGVLKAGGYLLKKAGLVQDASLARGESVLARDIETLGRSQAAQALVDSLGGRANPKGVLATLAENIHLHRKTGEELKAITARRATIVPYKAADKV